MDNMYAPLDAETRRGLVTALMDNQRFPIPAVNAAGPVGNVTVLSEEDYDGDAAVKPLFFNVWTLIVEHQHGTNVTVHLTEQSAKKELLDYVASWWDSEVGEDEMPENDDEAIEAYFTEVGDESYLISVAPVMP